MRFGVKVGSVTAADRKWPVFCSAKGKFAILEDEDDPDSDVMAKDAASFEAAEAQLRASLRKRKVKVAVPFRLHDGRRATATGIHGGNGDVLGRDEHGEAVRLSTMYMGTHTGRRTRGVFVADIPEERVERFAAIREEMAALEREKGEIERWYGVNLRERVEDAIRAKLDDA